MNNLEKKWRIVAKDLNLEIIAPFNLKYNDTCISVEILLKGYGAPNGMLITSDYRKIAEHIKYIEENGYGASVLNMPKDRDLEEYDVKGILGLLDDWGKTTTNTIYD